MKKFAGIMVATVLAFSLVACGPVDSAVQNLAGAASNKGSGVVTADDDGYAEGRIGDVMRTYFFDYTVNNAYTCKEFEGYTPAEGNKLLVAELTVKNTDRSTVTMYDTDFQIQWGDDDDDDAFDAPITYYSAAHDVIIKDISYNGFAVVSREDLELDVNQTVHAVLNDYLEETAENFNFHLYGLVARVQELENGLFLYGCRLSNPVPGLEQYIVKKERAVLRKRQLT